MYDPRTVPTGETVKITIDGRDVEVSSHLTILQVCEDLQIEIPVFCYHSRLDIAGNCRMCLVEVERMPKPVASCAMPVGNEMVIHTKSPMVQKAREGVLEFLLINHPLDCPICDQGGECDLQDITMNYSRGRSRFDLNKRAVPEQYMGPLIKTMMNRCIHCTRCVRFANTVAGVPEVGAIHRGEHMEITTLAKAATSELSGNMIDICPVGALTSKPYAFKGRPWELTKVYSIDVLDAVGSNIRIDTKGDRIKRILPRANEAINEEWISDKTRFSYDGLRFQRLDMPYRRVRGKLEPCTWSQALQTIQKEISKVDGSEIAGLVGDQADVEATYVFNLMLDFLGSPHRDCRQNGALYSQKDLTQLVHRNHYLFNTTIQGLETADFILLIGTNPRLEAPLVNARIKKCSYLNQTPIALIGEKSDLTYPYHHLGDTLDSIFKLYDMNHPVSKALHAAKKPAMIIGQGFFTSPAVAAYLKVIDGLLATYKNFIQWGHLPDRSSQEVESQIIWNGYNVLHTAASRVGALDVGFLPKEGGLDTPGILTACQERRIKVLFSYGADEVPVEALQEPFVVYIGHHGDRCAPIADVILPSAAYTEKDALYVNTEGRVQQTHVAVLPPGQAKADWAVMSELVRTFGQPLPFNNLTLLRRTICRYFPHLNPELRFNSRPDGLLSQYCWEKLSSAKTATLPKMTKVHKASGVVQYPITNPYMTCSITRHSPTMASCMKEMVPTRVSS